MNLKQGQVSRRGSPDPIRSLNLINISKSQKQIHNPNHSRKHTNNLTQRSITTNRSNKQVKMKMKRCPGFVFIKKQQDDVMQKDPLQHYKFNSLQIIKQQTQNFKITKQFQQKRNQMIYLKTSLNLKRKKTMAHSLPPCLIKLRNIINSKIITQIRKQNKFQKLSWNNALGLDHWLQCQNQANTPGYYKIMRNKIKDKKADFFEQGSKQLVSYTQNKLDQLYQNTKNTKIQLKKMISESSSNKNLLDPKKIRKVAKLRSNKKKVIEAFSQTFKSKAL